MNKTETKYFNTSIKMYNALFELLEHKNFLDITVKELCENNEMNYVVRKKDGKFQKK